MTNINLCRNKEGEQQKARERASRRAQIQQREASAGVRGQCCEGQRSQRNMEKSTQVKAEKQPFEPITPKCDIKRCMSQVLSVLLGSHTSGDDVEWRPHYERVYRERVQGVKERGMHAYRAEWESQGKLIEQCVGRADEIYKEAFRRLGALQISQYKKSSELIEWTGIFRRRVIAWDCAHGEMELMVRAEGLGSYEQAYTDKLLMWQ